MPDLPIDHDDDSEQETPAEETEEVEESGDEQDEDDKPLGPAGEKALQAEKDKRRTEAARRREAEKRAADLETELARLRKAADKPKNDQPKDETPDPDEVRREAEQAALAKANDRIIRAEIRAAAAGKLATPADALSFLDLTKFEVDPDGNVDPDEVADAIDDLIKKKPYLAVAQSDGKRFKGSGDGGAKPNKPARPKSLTEAVTKAMSPS